MGIAIIAGTMMTIDRAAAYLVRKYFRHGFAFTGSMMASQAQAAMYGILKNNDDISRSRIAAIGCMDLLSDFLKL